MPCNHEPAGQARLAFWSGAFVHGRLMLGDQIGAFGFAHSACDVETCQDRSLAISRARLFKRRAPRLVGEIVRLAGKDNGRTFFGDFGDDEVRAGRRQEPVFLQGSVAISGAGLASEFILAAQHSSPPWNDMRFDLLAGSTNMLDCGLGQKWA